MNRFNEARIRDKAYDIWEKMGRRQGTELKDWKLAKELLAEEYIKNEEDITLNPVTNHK